MYNFAIQFKLIKLNTMRKLFALLSVAAVMTLASCGAKSDESAVEATATDSVAVEVPAADSVAVEADSTVEAPAADSVSAQ